MTRPRGIVDPGNDPGALVDGGDPPCWAHLLDEAGEPIRDRELADLLRALTDAVLVCDRTGTILFWNASATALFGWSAEEAVGQSLDLIVPPGLRERHWAGYHDVMQTGRTDYDHRLLQVPARHRDGRIISIAFTLTLLRDETGPQPRLVAAVIRDDPEQWARRHPTATRLSEAIDT